MTAILKEERIGGQRLILGDSELIVDSLTSPGAILTDPPYGIEGTWSGGGRWKKFQRNGVSEANSWDSRPEWLSGFVINCDRPAIIWGGQYFHGLPASGSWLIWDKIVRNFTSGVAELAWTNLGMPIKAFNLANAVLVHEDKRHPTQKPLPLMEWCLGFVTNAQTILDPFMGSGTTLVACQRLGRNGTGIELDPDYFQIACERVEEATRQPDMFVTTPELPTLTQTDLLAAS